MYKLINKFNGKYPLNILSTKIKVEYEQENGNRNNRSLIF